MSHGSGHSISERDRTRIIKLRHDGVTLVQIAYQQRVSLKTVQRVLEFDRLESERRDPRRPPRTG